MIDALLYKVEKLEVLTRKRQVYTTHQLMRKPRRLTNFMSCNKCLENNPPTWINSVADKKRASF